MENFTHIINEFLDYKRTFSRKELSENTLLFYKNKIQRFISLTNLQIEDFGDEEKFEQAILKIAKIQIKTANRAKFIISAQQFGDFLVKRKYINSNEARKIPVPKSVPDLILPLTTEEIFHCRTAILSRWGNYLAERNLLIFDLFLYSGIRHSELTNLQKKDILDQKIFVHRGKGGKSRFIALPAQIFQRLQKFSEKIKNENDFIFAGRNGERATDRFLCAIFKNIQNITKIDVYPHKLRHTYASFCILAGLDIFTLKEQLGHSDIRTTTSYMAITNERRVQEVQNKISDNFGEIPQNFHQKVFLPEEIEQLL